MEKLKQAVKNFLARFRPGPVVVAVGTLQIAQNDQQCFWASGGKTVQVSFNGHVTNLTDETNKVTRVEIQKPPTQAGTISLSNNHDARRPQILNPHETADLHVTLFMKPVATKKGEQLKISLIFVDQHGNQHTLKNCIFKSV